MADPWRGLPGALLLVLAGELTGGVIFGAVSGFPCAVVASMVISSAEEGNPGSGIRWSWRGKSWLTSGLPIGLIYGVLFGLVAGPVSGLACALPFGLMGGPRSVHPDLDKAVGPGAVLARDRRTFSALTLGPLAIVFTTAFVLLLGVSPERDVAFGAAGLAVLFGLPISLMLGIARSVWMEFLVARIGLAVLGRVPWRLMCFLADAHQRRGVLRQLGAVYQFRHLDLQRHLAGRQP